MPAADTQDDHLPLLDDELEHGADARAGVLDVHGHRKTRWRGWIHAGMFPLAIVAGIVLIVLADGGIAKLSAAVFMATSLLLFGISALYHRIDWKPKTLALFRRLDHSNIFLLIAGTYTPLALCALPFPKSVILLSIVWFGALLGILSRIFWSNAPRWTYVPLYIALGWGAVLYVVDLVDFDLTAMLLIVIGGLAYTTGAIFYGLRRPNPVPGVFGFHELFHTATVVAFACHWTAILLIVTHPLTA